MVKNFIFLACVSTLAVSCNKGGDETAPAVVVSNESLFSVAETNDVDALAQLIQNGADLKAKSEGGNTLLHIAALHGATDVATKLIQSGVEVDALNDQSQTALMVATRAENIDTVKALLRLNASPELKDELGYLAISIAAESGNTELLEALALYSRQHLDQALFVASLKGYSDMINPLTNYGASVYSRIASDGRTPLMLAAQSGNLETVRVLLENGANRYSTNEEGQTASQLASMEGHDEIANYLGEIPNQDEFNIVEIDEAIVTEAVEKAAEADYIFASSSQPQGSTTPAPRKITAKYDTINTKTLQSAPAQLSEVIEIKTYREESLPVKVSAVDNEKVTVKYLYGDHKTREVKPGEIIPQTNLKVVSAEVKRDHSKMTAGKPADVSQVRVMDTTSGEVKQMTSGINVGRTEPFAVVKETGSDFFLVAKRGDLFTNKDGTKYEILEVRPSQLVIMNTTNGIVETIKK